MKKNMNTTKKRGKTKLIDKVKIFSFNLLGGVISIPSYIGAYLFQKPIQKSTCLIAKYGKIRPTERNRRILKNCLVTGDILGLLISATPLLITAVPYVLSYNESSHEESKRLDEILESNKK